jgi:hypothetical protein
VTGGVGVAELGQRGETLRCLRERLAQAQKAFEQLVLSASPLAPLDCVGEFAAQRLRQPREVVLEHIVLGAGAHRHDGDLLADRARDDDHGHVGVALADRLERLQAAEPGQIVVEQDRVPRGVAAAVERRQHHLERVDAARHR